MSVRPPVRRRDRGQATVELALALPVVVLLMLGLLQVVVVARDHLAVWHAARVGVRAGAVSTTPAAEATAASRAATTLEALEVSVQVDADWITVLARHRTATDLPLIGLLLPDITVEATATMAREPPSRAHPSPDGR
jgi:Flp pilus assembly protein TadG